MANDRSDEAGERLSELRADVSALKNDLSAVKNDFSTFKGDTTLRDEFSTVRIEFSALKGRVDLLLVILGIFLAAVGAMFLMLLSVSKDISSLNSKVSGYENEAFVKLVSAIKTDENSPEAKELKVAVENIAKDTFDKASRGERVAPGLYYELGTYSYNNGKVREAISYFEQAIKQTPADYRALSSLGACYLALAEKYPDRKDDYAEKALGPLKKAVGINQEHAKAHSNLGIAYILLNQRDQAIIEWKQALSLEPNSDFVNYNLACMFASEGKADEAIRYLNDAVMRGGYSDLAEIERDEARCFKMLSTNPKYMELKKIIARSAKSKALP